MGAVIGGLYACGSTPDGLQELMRGIKWSSIFQDAPDRPDRNFRRKEDDFEHLFPFEAGVKRNGLALPPWLDLRQQARVCAAARDDPLLHGVELRCPAHSVPRRSDGRGDR